MKAIKLMPPKSGGMYHFGRTSLDESDFIVHSDTLFSAICMNLRSLYGESVFQKLHSYLFNELQISSAFHYLDIYKGPTSDKQTFVGTLYFFPKPLITPAIVSSDQKFFEQEQKSWKKIRFVSKDVLEAIASGDGIGFNRNLILGEYLISEHDCKLLALDNVSNVQQMDTIKERLAFVHEIMEQKVKISRMNHTSLETFYQGNIFFSNSQYYVYDTTNSTNKKIFLTLKPGMFFLLNDHENKTPKEIIAAIRMIADAGLGGKRTTGKGLFADCQIKEFSFAFKGVEEISDSRDFLSLSVVIPNKEEISALKNYTLSVKRGFVYSLKQRMLRKRSITAIDEGSVFSTKITGKIVNVAPKIMDEHNVFRFGRAFLLPINRT